MLGKFAAPCFISTGNIGKLNEMIPMVREFMPWINEVQGMATQARENEITFVGNARIKAYALLNQIQNKKPELKNYYILADDSGMSVDALNGAPGVYSARYAGDHVDPTIHMQKVLSELESLKDLNQRKAHYTCALVLLYFDGQNTKEISAEGYCHGLIGFNTKGDGGFGYDPIFLDPKTLKSYSELSFEEKNQHSHRKEAFRALSQKF